MVYNNFNTFINVAKKQIKEKSIEEALWESANKLRGSVEPSEYKHVVLSLIFLKYANDRFTERRNELVADGKEAFADNPVFYNAKNVFYLEPESRWDYLIENSKQNDIAIKIDKALAKVEQNNPTLKGALPSNYYAGLSLDRTKLAADTFHNDQHKDLKADFIMANPPFNQKAWRAENELKDDPRWVGYDVPPTSNGHSLKS